jgi:hypothetical protein
VKHFVMDDIRGAALKFPSMHARTKSLFHFTKSLDKLLRILKEGFWPRYSLEDVRWLDVPETPKVAWPMACFCDIPISRLGAHTQFYGSYGIGLCRERWMATGLNPLLYVSPDSVLKEHLRERFLEARKNRDQRSKTNTMTLIAHCKPLEGEMLVNGEMKKKDFYSECEWRFTPWVVEGVDEENKHGFSLAEKDFHIESIRNEADNERRKDIVPFFPADITHLLVKSVEEAYVLVHFIDTEYGCSEDSRYPDDVLWVLKSRILVLEDILYDF